MATISFTYKPLNESGKPVGWMTKKGSLDGISLRLAGSSVDATSILHTVLIENVLAFTIPGVESNVVSVSLQIHSGHAPKLKLEIDRLRSAAQVAKTEREWQREGRAGAFRKEVCPNCQATLDLSRFDPTPQFFCDYCETISTVPKQPETPSNESDYRLCTHCGMYSRPRGFTEFYFYFLFVAYGFWTNRSLRCPACMRGTAWKMLAINFLFVLGIIPSAYQLIRAYFSDKIAGPFSGLHAANLKASRRDYSGATKIYQSILENVPAAAGVHYNLGLALTQNRQWQRAATAFELSLDDCSNYRYAAGGLLHCYEMLGRTSDLAALKSQWGQADEVPQTTR